MDESFSRVFTLESLLFLLQGKTTTFPPEQQVKDLLLHYREQMAWLAASGAPPQERLTLRKATIAEIEASHKSLERITLFFKSYDGSSSLTNDLTFPDQKKILKRKISAKKRV